MRDLPALAWIFGAFVVLAVIIGFYGSTGPEPLPPPQSAWASVEQFRSDIEFRRQPLVVGGGQDVVSTPYRFRFERLTDIESPNLISRYLVHIYPSGTIPMDRPWIGTGADLAMIDTEPGGTRGHIRLVAFRNVVTLKQ